MTKSRWSFWDSCSRMTEELFITKPRIAQLLLSSLVLLLLLLLLPFCYHRHLTMYRLYSGGAGGWNGCCLVLANWNVTKYPVLCNFSHLKKKKKKMHGVKQQDRFILGCAPLKSVKPALPQEWYSLNAQLSWCQPVCLKGSSMRFMHRVFST